MHGAKFEDPDHLIIETEAPLSENYGPSAVQLDQQRDDRHPRADKDQHQRSEYLVFAPLDESAPVLEGPFGDFEHRHVADTAHGTNLECFCQRLDTETHIDGDPLQLFEKRLEPPLGVEGQGDNHVGDRNMPREAEEVVGRTEYVQAMDGS